MVKARNEVGIETGPKRTFACAFDWPGWARSGRDEEAALEALSDYRVRYAAVVKGSGVAFRVPAKPGALQIAERVEGNATTDFGAPDGEFATDADPMDRRELTRSLKLLDACWLAFDDAVEGARGVELRTGPRGGGRELDAIVDHVVGAEASYGRKLAVKVAVDEDDAWRGRTDERAQVRDGLRSAVIDGMPEAGPRGGKLWSPRRFLRRAAWHVLDHAWEIEDRAGSGEEPAGEG